MSLVSYIAQQIKNKPSYETKELSLAGVLNTEIGDAVLEINKILAAVDPDNVINILNTCKCLHYGKPLSYLDHPLKTHEFQFVSSDELTLQSTRLGSLFSADGGETWYDIDRSPKYRSFWLFVYHKIFRTASWIKPFMRNKLLYYVSFPYEPESHQIYKYTQEQTT